MGYAVIRNNLQTGGVGGGGVDVCAVVATSLKLIVSVAHPDVFNSSYTTEFYQHLHFFFYLLKE